MTKKIALALQGGGSHGAYTWGILERLLEEENLEITGVVGTSAGAMNAAVCVYGLHVGGNKKAIELLQKFWMRVSNNSIFTPFQAMMDTPAFSFFNVFASSMSPYQFNPLDINPLREILVGMIDFKELNKSDVKLFVSATNVKKGKAKIFSTPELNVDMLMASACIPLLFKAVCIDGEYYWDGGYMGNPPIYPLIDHTDCSDILLVKVDPTEIKELPTSVSEIQDRINDISFNSSLSAEMRMIHFKDKVVDEGYDMKGKLRKIYLHEISADEDLQGLSLSSKSNITPDFLLSLRAQGRVAAQNWLTENFDKIEMESTLNISQVFL